MALTKVKTGVVDDSVFEANKNAIINGNFDIWQRGTSGFTTSGYTADRWRVIPGTGVTFSVARQTNTLGDGQSEFALRWDQTVAGSTASLIEQRIEGVQTFNGQTVTISVDTDLVSGSAPTVQLRLQQNFGTGGSPSAAVFSAATAISIPASRTNQSVTFSVPTITGKTLGSNGDDYLAVQFVIGNAVFAMDLNECQIEAGSVATTFERRSFAQELAMAQRYTMLLEIGQDHNGDQNASTVFRYYEFPTELRSVPTASIFSQFSYFSGGGSVNFTPTFSIVATTGITIKGTGLTLGRGFVNGTALIDAEL